VPVRLLSSASRDKVEVRLEWEMKPKLTSMYGVRVFVATSLFQVAVK
jgi:hypothetical protein